MQRIAARFKHAGVFVTLTAPFLTLSVASPAMAATPLTATPLSAASGTALLPSASGAALLPSTSETSPLSAVPLAADSASDDNIWLTIAIVAVGVALMSCIALALTMAKARRNRAKPAQPVGAPVFQQMPSAPSAPALGTPGFPQPGVSAPSAPALGYRPYIAPTPSLAPTAPGGLPLTAHPVNEAYPQRYGMPSQPDSGDLATLSHPNQNVQLAHELATPEGNQTRLVSTDGVAHAYPAEEPAWQMPSSGPSN